MIDPFLSFLYYSAFFLLILRSSFSPFFFIKVSVETQALPCRSWSERCHNACNKKRMFFFTNQKSCFFPVRWMKRSRGVQGRVAPPKRDTAFEPKKNIGEAAMCRNVLLWSMCSPPDCLGHAGENALTHRHVGHTAAT